MSKQLFHHFIALSIVCIFFFADTSALFAQEDEDEFTLEEITVTAQKRQQNVQKVPIAMQVATGDVMKELGQSSLDQVVESMAGVFVNEAGDGLRVSIRGISSDETTRGDLYTYSNASPTVAVNMDGVFTFGRKSGASMYDIERVEVLYGPQSTLYSSNSPGGIVNIVTASPKTDKYEVSALVKYGNYHTLETQGMANVPVDEKTALRASFNTSSHDGHMSNGAASADSKSVRAKILHNFTDQFNITLTGEYLLGQGIGQGQGVAMFKDEASLDNPWDNRDQATTTTPRDRRSRDFNLQGEWLLGVGTLSFSASLSRQTETAHIGKIDNSTGETYTDYMDNWQKEHGGEVRLASSSDTAIQWIAGATYFKFRQQGFGETVGTPYYSGTQNEAETYAAYANITYPLTDTFRVTGGLRYSDDKNDGLFAMVSETMEMFRPESLHYDGLDHKIGFEYNLSENSMLFTDWTTGYRVGSMGGATEPETMDAYSLGAKSRFFNNKLQLNATAYLYQYKNYAAECHQTDPDSLQLADGGETQADMEMYGVDIQSEIVLSPKDRLSLSVAYQHAEFSELVFEYTSDKIPDLVYTGKSPTFTPDWTVTAGYEHNFLLPNGSSLTPRIDVRFQSEQMVSFQEYAGIQGEAGLTSLVGYVEQEAYHMSNFTLLYASLDRNWTMTGYINNIEDYAVKKNYLDERLTIGDPRTYGVVFSVKY